VHIAGLKILNSKKFNVYFHRTSLIKLTQVFPLFTHPKGFSTLYQAHNSTLIFSFVFTAILYLNFSIQCLEDIMYLILETPGQHFISFVQNE
jgi:hypothetical protein